LSLEIGGLGLGLQLDGGAPELLRDTYRPFLVAAGKNDLMIDVGLLPWQVGTFEQLEAADQALLSSCYDYLTEVYAPHHSHPQYGMFIHSRMDHVAGFLPSEAFRRQLEMLAADGSGFLFWRGYHYRGLKGLGLLFLDSDLQRGSMFVSQIGDPATEAAIVDALVSVAYAMAVRRHQGILLHAAGIAREGRGYVFAGPTGSGKTTLARRSRQFTVLADDGVVIRRQNGSFVASSTPWNLLAPSWHADFQQEPVRSVGLEAVFFLSQGQATKVVPAELKLGVAQVMRNLLPQRDGWNRDGTGGHLLDFCLQLCRQVACYDMSVCLADDFWTVIDGLSP
jgi:hypothetical protein